MPTWSIPVSTLELTQERPQEKPTIYHIIEEEGIEEVVRNLLLYCEARIEETQKEFPATARHYERETKIFTNAYRIACAHSL